MFGVRKMYAFLNNGELAVGHVARCTVERLMRRMGIRGVSRRRARHATASAPRHACPADLVNRHFGAHDLNELWVADITYVPTQARVSEALCMRFNPQSRRRVRNNDCCVPEEA